MSTTAVVKCKCMSCSLHFIGYSFREEWRPTFCPECGSSGPFMVWVGDSNQEIFMHVPGSTMLTEFGYVSPGLTTTHQEG